MSFNPTAAEILHKNHIYDSSSSPIWRLIYDCVHGGRQFANMGGKEVLDQIARYAGIDSRSSVVELCCGSGATVEYMATVYGCRVKGLELNPHQLELAKRRIIGQPSLMAKVEFILTDLLEWTPVPAHDLAYSIDSLMLVSKLEEALISAYRGLRAGGILALAEITAGPLIDDAARRYAWDEDGILNLLSPAQYKEQLGDAGFVDIECRDLDQFAQQRSACIHFAIRDHAQELADLVHPKAYQGWLQSTALYWDAFAGGKYGYSLITAMKK